MNEAYRNSVFKLVFEANNLSMKKGLMEMCLHFVLWKYIYQVQRIEVLYFYSLNCHFK
uniref:Uncharacterized protein n=1 Tax=Rhizophora mucronata TaxID=61149 RepID=A0A2P2MZV9_RHIMU